MRCLEIPLCEIHLLLASLGFKDFTKCIGHPFQKSHSKELACVASPGRLLWKKNPSEMVLKTPLQDMCSQFVSQDPFPTDKIILDRTFTFMGCSGFFWLLLMIHLEFLFFKIWSYNHNGIRRDNMRSKLRIIKP